MPIVFSFDLRIIAIFVALAFLVQGTVIGAQAYLIRDLRQYHGVGMALAANLCVAVGLMLRLFMDQLPGFFTTILSTILLLTGSSLFYIALSQFTGFTYSKSLVIGILAAALFFLVYFKYWDDDLRMRLITFTLGSMAMVIMLIVQLWRTQKTALRFSANLMLGSFVVHGIFLLVRTINLLLESPEDAFSVTPVQSATYLLSFAISFFWSTGFILMVSQRLRNDLMEVATIDVLTRIPNRRATQGFIEKELSRAQRNQSEFSVLLIDIDNFKQVNDRWGHSVGDHTLVKTAGIFQSMIRKEDWVGRWGGEEFLMIVPGSPHCDAEPLAERVRRAIAASEYNHSSAPFGITVSIGVACADRSSTVDEILKKADDALYRAKVTKNTVKVAQE
jgi:diguanylate cyclase (GGDEF)-like protein